MTTTDGQTRLRRARFESDAPSLRALREAVFVVEQGVPPEIEWDGRDAGARHLIAERDGAPVGCGRLLPDGRIGRLAVRAPLRGGGIGALLLQGLLQLAREEGMRRVYLHAQASAEDFYRRAGFLPDGPLFDEAGIAHRNMLLQLDYRACDHRVAAVAWPQPFRQLVVAQAQLARRELFILSPHLDPQVFDDPALRPAITRLLRSAGRRGRVRIVVQDLRAVIESGHGLLQLAQRLPSGVSMRWLPEHPDWSGETWVLRDQDSLLRHPGAPRGRGAYLPGDRARASQALARLEALWRAAQETPELRRVAL